MVFYRDRIIQNIMIIRRL